MPRTMCHDACVRLRRQRDVAEAAKSESSSSPSPERDALRDVSVYTRGDLPAKTVFARMGNMISRSDYKCCAERRNLQQWIQRARRNGVADHQIVWWVRRKGGAEMEVWRLLRDERFACAVPCTFCKRALSVFEPKVICSVSDSVWFEGRLSDPNSPASKLTLGQRRLFGRL